MTDTQKIMQINKELSLIVNVKHTLTNNIQINKTFLKTVYIWQIII